MKRFAKMVSPFFLCLLVYLPAFSTEDDIKDEPTTFTSEQLSALTSDDDCLIGGLISPLSGTPCLRETDFTVIGAQEISLTRVYLSPYMPYFFNKQLDADCYYRCLYLTRHYEGWKFFPHLYLWFDGTKQQVHLINPNATTYDFSIAESKTTLLHSYAVSNSTSGETPSGKFDPRNTRISYKEDYIVVYSADGFTRFYQKKRGCLFILNKEILPNGKIIKYYYTDTGRLFQVESLDPTEKYIYASIGIQGSPLEGKCTFTSSTGLNTFYKFENQRIQGKFNEGNQKVKYTLSLPPVLTEVNSPHYRGEVSHHNSNCLLRSFSGKNRVFSLSHAPFGECNRVHLRVNKLFLPVGQNDESAPSYQISYQPAVAGTREGKTIVKNRDDTSTVYYFSKNLLITSIQDFGKDGGLKKEKKLSWNDKNWLASVELKDGDNNQLCLTNYEYDDFGNAILETLIGDLQGAGQKDHFVIKRNFSQDGRNLLLKEETEDGKVTTFEYLPTTDLPTLKLISDTSRVLIRESFQYDEYNNLIQKCIDDNDHQRRTTNYILRQQQPFLHMPEWVEEKYLEKGLEKILKRTHLSYDQYGNISEEQVYDANNTHAYSILKEYNERGDIVSETNPTGQRRAFIYDSKGQCIEQTSFSQLKEEMCYDTKGSLVEKKAIGADSVHITSYRYDFNNDLKQEIDIYNNVFHYSYDPLVHKVTRIECPSILNSNGQSKPVVTSSTYDALGRETSKTDGNGDVTRYSYNAYDFPVEITYPNGSKEFYRYKRDGRVASHVDRKGLAVQYTHDVLGRITSKSYGEDIGNEYYYYDAFNLLKETGLDGTSTHYRYDGAGRKVLEEKCGRIITYAYDSLGRLSEINRGGLKTHLKRDLVNRITEERKTDSDNKPLYKISFTYDENGNLNRIIRNIDGKESIETFSYDVFNREVCRSDALGHKTSTTYNEHYINELGQRLVQITTVNPLNISKIKTLDPFSRDTQEKVLNSEGMIISFREKFYDPCGNVTDWKDFRYENERLQDLQVAQFTYNSDGRIESSTRAFGTAKARTTRYTYTADGKIETKMLPDGITLRYTYTRLGFLEMVRSSDEKIQHRFDCDTNGDFIGIFDDLENISIQREVDPFGNIIREVFSNHIDVKKTYDALDRPITLQINNIGLISYTYDPLYLRKISRFSTDGKLQYVHQYVTYDLDGNLLLENMLNNLGDVHHRIDVKGRESEITSPHFSQKCLYDAQDNLVRNRIDEKSTSYTYDDLSQLTGEGEITYGYDSLLNRRFKNSQGFQINDLNELEELDFDTNGNQTKNDDIHYTYDPLNRLIEANRGERKICLKYDPLGRRLAKLVMDKAASEWTECYREDYLYDGKYEIGALNADGTLKNFRAVAILHKPISSAAKNNDNLITDLTIPSTIAVELNQKIFATITDAQRNICRLVDPLSKKAIGHYQFTAFGEDGHQGDENPWRYAAKRFDPELNLINFGQRYYNPELGRWLTTDPAGFLDNLNLYQYALNNPLRYYDPDGEFFFLLTLPVAQMLCGAIIVEAIVDAVVLGTVAAAFWEGSKYVNHTIEKRGDRGEHTKNARPSSLEKHQRGNARKERDQRLAEARREQSKKKSKNRNR